MSQPHNISSFQSPFALDRPGHGQAQPFYRSLENRRLLASRRLSHPAQDDTPATDDSGISGVNGIQADTGVVGQGDKLDSQPLQQIAKPVGLPYSVIEIGRPRIVQRLPLPADGARSDEGIACVLEKQGADWIDL